MLSPNGTTRSGSREWLLALRYREFKVNSQDLRDRITTSVDADFSKMNIGVDPRQLKMPNVLDTLVQRVYGFQPMTVNYLKATLDGLKRYGTKTVGEVHAIETWEGGFMGVKSNPLHSLEVELQRHPGISAGFILPESELISNVIAELGRRLDQQTKGRDGDIRNWLEVRTNFANWEEWGFAAWRNLRDADCKGWKAILDELDRDSIIGFMQQTDDLKPMTTAVDGVRAAIKRAQDEDEQRSQQKVPVGPANVPLPTEPMLLMFPFLFLLSMCMARMLWLEKRISMMKVAAIEHRLKKALRSPVGSGIVGAEVLNSYTAMDYLKQRDWAKLFENDLALFADAFYDLATFSLAVYIGVRWIEFMFLDRPEAYRVWAPVLVLALLVSTALVQFATRKIVSSSIVLFRSGMAADLEPTGNS